MLRQEHRLQREGCKPQEKVALTPSAASMKSTTPSEMRRPAVTSSEKFT